MKAAESLDTEALRSLTGLRGTLREFKSLFKEALHSRSFMALWGIMLLQIILLMILASIYIHPGQQVPVRYSAFAEMQYFRAQWFYLLNFVIFGLAVFGFNSLISLKLLGVKGRHMALSFLWLSIIVLTVAILLIAAVLRVAGIQ